jgi:hypothetical protein
MRLPPARLFDPSAARSLWIGAERSIDFDTITRIENPPSADQLAEHAHGGMGEIDSGKFHGRSRGLESIGNRRRRRQKKQLGNGSLWLGIDHFDLDHRTLGLRQRQVLALAGAVYRLRAPRESIDDRAAKGLEGVIECRGGQAVLEFELDPKMHLRTVLTDGFEAPLSHQVAKWSVDEPHEYLCVLLQGVARRELRAQHASHNLHAGKHLGRRLRFDSRADAPGQEFRVAGHVVDHGEHLGGRKAHDGAAFDDLQALASRAARCRRNAILRQKRAHRHPRIGRLRRVGA